MTEATNGREETAEGRLDRLPADRRPGVAEPERAVRREAGGETRRVHGVDGIEQPPRLRIGRIGGGPVAVDANFVSCF